MKIWEIPPVASMDAVWAESERYAVMQMLNYTFIGSGMKVKSKLSEFVSDTGINEIMITSHIFDHGSRVRLYEIISELCLRNKQTYISS